mgnify:CR=1 FL=1
MSSHDSKRLDDKQSLIPRVFIFMILYGYLKKNDKFIYKEHVAVLP